MEKSLELETPSRMGTEVLLESLAQAIAQLAKSKRKPPGGKASLRKKALREETSATKRPLLVGIAVPGFLDPMREKVVRLANLPALNGVRLKDEIQRKAGALVVLDTDTNAGALAEATLGGGAGFERVLYLSMGTGLGAALVVAGKPVRVSHHTIGQVAHIPMDPAGPPCYCGDRGCAETLLSSRGILWRARRAGLRGIRSTEDLCAIGRRAGQSQGNVREGALTVWEETGDLVGSLLRILVGLFSPDIVVLGGGIAGAASLFLPQARRHLRRHLAPRIGTRVILRPARIGRFAGAVGAALLALD